MQTHFPSGLPLQESAARALRGFFCTENEDGEQLLARLARAFSRAEEQPQAWEQTFRRALPALVLNSRLYRAVVPEQRGFLSEGVLLDGFVLPVADSFIGADGVDQLLRDVSSLLAKRYRLGVDCSALRPCGANGENVDAPSALTCIRHLHNIAAERHADEALLISVRIDHPDILALLEGLQRGVFGALRVSISIPDEFMEALLYDREFALSHRTAPTVKRAGGQHCEPDSEGYYRYQMVSPTELWQQLLDYAQRALEQMREAQASFYPPLIFSDRAESSSGTLSPDAGVLLPPYAGVAVAQVNVALFVSEPCTPQARFDEQHFADTVATAVRLLDNALCLSKYPHPRCADSTQRHRPLALGLIGVAEALALLNISYGTAAAELQTHRWAGQLKQCVYRASVQLAAERGRSAGLSDEQIFDVDSRVGADLCQQIGEVGLRHSRLLGLAAPWPSRLALGNGVTLGAERIEPAHALWSCGWNMPQERTAVLNHACRWAQQRLGADTPIAPAMQDDERAVRKRMSMIANLNHTLDNGLAPLLAGGALCLSELGELYCSFWKRTR